MSLQIKRNKDGTLASMNWYADFQVGGKRHVVPLKTKINGTVPATLKVKKGDPVDAAFERSRGAAKAEHDEIVAEARKKGATLKILEHIADIRTEGRSRSMPLDKLADSWASLSRKRKPSSDYLNYGRGILADFVEKLQAKHGRVKTLTDVTAEHVKEYMDAEEARHLASRTWNEKLTFIKSAFSHLDPAGDVCRKIPSVLPLRTEDTVHRKPFDRDEIKAILDAAESDDLIRPLIVTALSTAMRRGDCALLRWSSVDMEAGFITVKTMKTHETIEIPIMPLLYDELKTAAIRKHGSKDYVFPKAAAIYQHNPEGLNQGLRRILAQAGFVDEKVVERAKEAEKKRPRLPTLPAVEVRARGMEAIAKMECTDAKRERMMAVFTAYMDGASVKKVAEKLNVVKGTVSGHLNELEDLLKVAVVRRQLSFVPATIRGALHSDADEQRLNRGSLRGWHSFRTTFITLALSAGMPMELVQRITGHTTVAVVMKHYFRPNRETFRQALQLAMPKLLTERATPTATA